MRVIMAGGSGYLGRKLVALLKDDYEVVVLSRTPERHTIPGAKVVGWDARTASGWGQLADGAHAIVNLAGEDLAARPWTQAQKARIMNSRIDAGRAIVEAVRAAAVKPAALLQSSAVGYYGDAPRPVDENSAPGTDFLADVCKAWEASTAEVESMGVRRAVFRTGVVLDPNARALQRMIVPFKLFIGGPLGSGRQYLPWIHPDDEVGAICFLMGNEDARGPYNLTAPNPLANAEFARVLGEVMGRPSFMPAPAFAIRLVFGEMSVVVLEGQHALPKRLLDAGYKFKFSSAEAALRDLLK